jgi:phage shock protein A
MDIKDYKPKSFWQKPEGVTGAIFLAGLIGGLGFLVFSNPTFLATLFSNVLYMTLAIVALFALVYVILDPKARTLISYGYKSIMRWITGLFVQIDPIGILKSYIDDLEDNLKKMNKQISKLRGQMHKLNETIHNNKKAINSNLELASKAKDSNKQAQMILKSRKAGRLKESNMRLGDLYKKMEVLYRVLSKMYENSEILSEDLKDQVAVKEQERKAIHASHSAMKSAMNIISGNKDQRYMFDMALEAIADDVSTKVGEMERFMDMSSSFMDSIDLQNGVFEEEGLKMLEKWEKEGVSKILGAEKSTLLLEAEDDKNVLDLNAPIKKKVRAENHINQYDTFFD